MYLEGYFGAPISRGLRVLEALHVLSERPELSLRRARGRTLFLCLGWPLKPAEEIARAAPLRPMKP